MYLYYDCTLPITLCTPMDVCTCVYVYVYVCVHATVDGCNSSSRFALAIVGASLLLLLTQGLFEVLVMLKLVGIMSTCCVFCMVRCMYCAVSCFRFVPRCLRCHISASHTPAPPATLCHWFHAMHVHTASSWGVAFIPFYILLVIAFVFSLIVSVKCWGLGCNVIRHDDRL